MHLVAALNLVFLDCPTPNEGIVILNDEAKESDSRPVG